jgi:hypothetical protein
MDDQFIDRCIQRFNLRMDADWSMRQQKLHILSLFKDGRIYDNLPPWDEEYAGGENSGSFIRMRKRRPSVIYKIPKIIVNESVAMLFGEGRFPVARCDDKKTQKFLTRVTKCANLKYKMLEAARIGSLGSVCIILKVLKGKLHLDILSTSSLTPYFDVMAPDTLERIVDKRKILGSTLMSKGYDNIKDDEKKKWFFLVREWTAQEEIHYNPYLVILDKEGDFKPARDIKRSVAHDLGFVPAVWIKNTATDSNIDGECTFGDVVDTCVEIDYQLSQLGRLLKYNSDPTLVIKDVAKLEGQELIKGVGALEIGKDGDAYLLEMSTGATTSVIEFVRQLRECALEVVRGNRANPDKMSGIHSGKALQMLNSPLVSLVDELRLTYGDYGLIKIYEMMIAIYQSGKYELDLKGYEPGSSEYEGKITLDWGEWYPPTPQDNLQESQSLTTLANAVKPLLSVETAIKTISDKYNIENTEEELQRINNDDNMQTEKLKARTPEKPGLDAKASKGVDRQKD